MTLVHPFFASFSCWWVSRGGAWELAGAIVCLSLFEMDEMDVVSYTGTPAASPNWGCADRYLQYTDYG